MKKFRILSLVLAALMVSVLLAGCGAKEKPADTTTLTTTTSEETTTTTEPKLSFGGYTFTMLGAASSAKGSALWYPTPDSAGKQEVMDAYKAIEDEYDCSITLCTDAYTVETLYAAFFAGDKVADFVYLEDEDFGRAVLQGYIRKLDTDEVRATGMDVLNPEQFDVVSIKAGMLGGGVYCCRITNETLNAQLGTFYCFNKTLSAAAGYPSDVIYKAVRDYTWTWDVVIDICHAGTVYNDETGAYDINGISRVFTDCELQTLCKGLVYWNGEKYVSSLGEVTTLAALNTVVNRLIMDPSVMYTNMSKGVGTNYGNSASRQCFYDQKAIFGMFDNLNDPFGGCSFPYGLVPLPRGSAMDEYVSALRSFQTYICPNSNQDWEKSCAIMGLIGNALNRQEESTVSFETKTYDAESIEMLNDYIFPNIVNYIASYSADAATIFWNEVRGGIRAGASPASAVEANKDAYNQAIERDWAYFNKK